MSEGASARSCSKHYGIRGSVLFLLRVHCVQISFVQQFKDRNSDQSCSDKGGGYKPGKIILDYVVGKVLFGNEDLCLPQK